MGMTIEEIKEEIRSDLTSKKMTGDSYSESFRDALANLLIIAEKYQKIEQIYNSWRTGDYKGSKECMEDIGEVIEDGNDD